MTKWTAVPKSEPKVNEWEEELAAQILLAGLPAPMRQYPFAKNVGRQYRADFAFMDERLLVEVNGGAFIGGRHTRGAGYEDDLQRNAIATALGWRVVSVTPSHIKKKFAIEWIKCALGLEELTVQWAKIPKKKRLARAA